MRCAAAASQAYGAGIAPVKATAPIAVGDVLMTSTVAGYAVKAPPGTAVSSTIGSALQALPTGSGPVRVRIGMVAQ